MTTKKTIKYIDNEKFYEAMCNFIEDCNQAEADGKELPRVPEYVGECFILLARNIARAPNFSRYPFIQDMQSDAVLNCIKYIRNFKPTRVDPETGKTIKNKPFSYFSQYVFNTFKQSIKTEKNSLYSRYKEVQAFQITEQLAGQPDALPPWIKDVSNKFIERHEESLEREKERKKANRSKSKSSNSISNFFEDDTPK